MRLRRSPSLQIQGIRAGLVRGAVARHQAKHVVPEERQARGAVAA